MRWDKAWEKILPILKIKIKLPTFGRKEVKNGNRRRSKRVVVENSLKEGD
jgi:hypothetical protein